MIVEGSHTLSMGAAAAASDVRAFDTQASGYRATGWVLAALFAGLVVMFGGGLFGATVLAQRTSWGEGLQLETGGDPASLENLFVRWDANFYVAVAIRGYPSPTHRRTAFFPLYPMLARGLTDLSGIPLLWAGLLTSLACLAASCAALYRWVRTDHPQSVARWSVASLCLFPLAFFFAGFYAEPLFLLCSIAALWSARERRFVVAGLCIALAGATRPQAFLLVIPIVVEAWIQRKRTSVPQLIVCLLIAPLGTLGYLGWLAREAGDISAVTAYLQVTGGEWKTATTWPWVTVWDGLRAATLGTDIGSDWFSRLLAVHDLLYAALGLALAVWSIGRVRASLSAYLLVGMLVLLTVHGPYGYAFWGLGRRLATLVPIFPVLGLLATQASRRQRYAGAAVSIALLGVGAAWFASGRWIA